MLHDSGRKNASEVKTQRNGLVWDAFPVIDEQGFVGALRLNRG